ncbi:response regulator transcription factor [Shewanella youngdeokensis]|uniref:Response regulator transcription factor n=1 Tax=Shewanella youngdeokensis TaxID=2999068 RepID=A0ABZ0JTU3_9GAMM|nr:response regulator transcription factor [Shewanella sp. DAU334]
MKNILIVDQDEPSTVLLKEELETHHFNVTTAFNDQEAADKLGCGQPDIIALNIGPSIVAGTILSHLNTTPVIVTSSVNTEQERIRAFEYGADDFLTKPFSVKELIVRINAIKRRINLVKKELDTDNHQSQVIHFDPSCFKVSISSKDVLFTQTEFKIFQYLFERKGQVIDKHELQLRVLNKEYGQFDRNLDMHISNARRKLAATQLPKSLINTVRGKGYVFVDQPY